MSEQENAPNPFMVQTGMLHNEEKYQQLMTELTGKTKEQRKAEIDEVCNEFAAKPKKFIF